MIRSRGIGLLFLLLSTSTAMSEGTPGSRFVLPTAGSEIHSIAEYAEYLEDPSGTLSIEDVMLLEDERRFVPQMRRRNIFEKQDGVYWVRLRFLNESDNPEPWLLIARMRDTTTAYIVTASGVVDIQRTGDRIPLVHKAFPHAMKSWFDAVQLPHRIKGPFTVYLRTVGSANTRYLEGSEITLMSTGAYADWRRDMYGFQGVYAGIIVTIILYLMIISVSMRDRRFILVAVIGLSSVFYFNSFNGVALELIWPDYPLFILDNRHGVQYLFLPLFFLGMFFFFTKIMKMDRTYPRLYRFLSLFSIVTLAAGPLSEFVWFRMAVITFYNYALASVAVTISVLIFLEVVRGQRSARLLALTIMIQIAGGVLFALQNNRDLPATQYSVDAFQIGTALMLLCLSIVLAERINTMRLDKERAQLETIDILRENERIIAEQNVLLERKVEERTQALERTQTQLVHQEKLASLGSLTAGIAHEIRNPLNFVNNFSSLSAELLDDLRRASSEEQRAALIDDLAGNLSRIEEHGKRADDIVRSMMMHARAPGGEREHTDINALLAESVQRAYHGMKARKTDFEITLRTNFDRALAPVRVTPQEMSRVFVNVLNNAMYAVSERWRAALADSPVRIGADGIPSLAVDEREAFEPVVTVSTRARETSVEIVISDSGPGIPDEIKRDIFQPFFTTKPAGDGNGLGLSMSFDIVKAHGGTMEARDASGGGAEIVITLPLNAS